jgi:nucleoside-diphosphate-sugar epimerase
MRIVVTGSSGRIGKYVVRELVSAKHEVLGIDVLPTPAEVGRGMCVDLTDAGQVYGALGGFRAEAVIHMGAWANPGHVPDTRTYADNVQGTYNVFQACADLGIERVVSASSAQVYGFHEHAPDYVRVDESHPLKPINCYALSKIAGESAAEYFSRNSGTTILSFRFQGVRLPSEMDEQIGQMARDPAGGRRLFWTRTDARDAAMACRLAVEVYRVDSGIYNITGSRIVLDTPVTELVRAHFGVDVEIREQDDWKSPMSCEHAREAFGYDPQYPWTVKDRFPE